MRSGIFVFFFFILVLVFADKTRDLVKHFGDSLDQSVKRGLCRRRYVEKLDVIAVDDDKCYRNDVDSGADTAAESIARVLFFGEIRSAARKTQGEF